MISGRCLPAAGPGPAARSRWSRPWARWRRSAPGSATPHHALEGEERREGDEEERIGEPDEHEGEDTEVHRPKVTEVTALGAAYLAGLAVGYWNSIDELQGKAEIDRSFLPHKDEEKNIAAGYLLGRRKDAEQEEAEFKRLLYVAVTRAEEKVLLSGTISLKKDHKLQRTRGWLASLAETDSS